MWLCRAVLVTELRRELRARCKSHKPDCTSWAFANALKKQMKDVNEGQEQGLRLCALVLTYIFLLPDIKVDCCLGNNHGIGQGASLTAQLLKRVRKSHNIKVYQSFGFVPLVLSLALPIPAPSLTMAASASCASLMKWFRTLRSQIGLSGVGRLGWVHSNTINRKASNPAIPDAKNRGQRSVERQGRRPKKQQEQEEPLVRGKGCPKEARVARAENRNLSSMVNPAMVLRPHMNKHLPITWLHLATKQTHKRQR